MKHGIPRIAFSVAIMAASGSVTKQVLAEIPTRHVHFWIKSFIANPSNGATNDFVMTDNGKWVIKAPLTTVPIIQHVLPAGCFAIDNRGFSTDPMASARVTFEADLVVRARDISIEPFAGRNLVRIGPTHNVNCKTDLDLSPPRSASDSSVSIGDVKSSQRGRMLVFNVKASTADPFYDFIVISAPKLDFEAVFTFDVIKQSISILGSTGIFPSYEAYYSVNNGPVIKVLNRAPEPGTGAATLADFGTGINTENFSEDIELPIQ